MKRKRTISFVLAAGCLLAGSALYVLFRPTTLLMFHWADALGLTGSIGTMRASLDGLDKYLPSWTVNSLPFALWVVSYMFFINGIWGNSISLVRSVWFWCIPVIAIAAELAQSMHIIPGRFDLVDAVMIIVATTLGFFLTELNHAKKGVPAS